MKAGYLMHLMIFTCISLHAQTDTLKPGQIPGNFKHIKPVVYRSMLFTEKEIKDSRSAKENKMAKKGYTIIKVNFSPV